MKIGITGSRKIDNVKLVEFLIKFVLTNYEITPTELNSGGADGVDKIVENLFKSKFNIEPKIFKPDYKKYKGNERYAPLARNLEIIENSDVIVAIWEGIEYGTKGGTRFTAEKAKESGKRVIFINVEEGTVGEI